MLYEATLSPHAFIEKEAPLLASLVAWEARTLRDSLPEFTVFLAISFGVVGLVKSFMGMGFGHSSGSVMGGIGSMLVFAVAFRLNVCMSRWWEGRC
jgi:predicted membrane chloride channel (bestrophin family)